MATSSKQVGFVLVLCAFSQLPMLGGVFVYLPLDGEAERARVCARYYIDQHSNPLCAVFYIDDQLHIIIWTQGTIIQHMLAHIGMPPLTDSSPPKNGKAIFQIILPLELENRKTAKFSLLEKILSLRSTTPSFQRF